MHHSRQTAQPFPVSQASKNFLAIGVIDDIVATSPDGYRHRLSVVLSYARMKLLACPSRRIAQMGNATQKRAYCPGNEAGGRGRWKRRYAYKIASTCARGVGGADRTDQTIRGTRS
jgi:hypothetical protein